MIDRLSDCRHRSVLTFVAAFVATCTSAFAVLPEFTVDRNEVHIKGVGPDNSIICDNNYLWAQASLGESKLVGNVVSRDMREWKTGCQYPMKQCVDDANKTIKTARNSGLKNIPNITIGSEFALKPPANGKIEHGSDAQPRGILPSG